MHHSDARHGDGAGKTVWPMEAKENIEVLICTVDEGIRRVPDVLSPTVRGDVRYLVSFQYTDKKWLEAVPEMLKRRADVKIVVLAGRGLSVNRNHAFDHSSGDIVLVADDDSHYRDRYFDAVQRTFASNMDVDIALFRGKSHEGHWLKRYPETACEWASAPRWTYASSWEMAVRRRALARGVRFNEHFGLGSEFLASGEEDVFLSDAVGAGLRVVYFPETVVETDGDTTGGHFLDNVRVQRSKGAVFCYRYGMFGAAFRCAKEAFGYFVRRGVNPLPLMRNMTDGIRYCRRINDGKSRRRRG